MIICMFKIICVTNRRLCSEDFFERIEKISAAKPDRIILREKDLNNKEYTELAFRVLEISRKYGVPCSVYSQCNTFKNIHMTMPALRECTAEVKTGLILKGTSVHSVEEAAEAEKLGADYIIAGHIFPTGCKPDLAPRGVEFLREVCKSVHIPVYAIGGINSANISEIAESGASGACIMSGFMTCSNPTEFVKVLRQQVLIYKSESKNEI